MSEVIAVGAITSADLVVRLVEPPPVTDTTGGTTVASDEFPEFEL